MYISIYLTYYTLSEGKGKARKARANPLYSMANATIATVKGTQPEGVQILEKDSKEIAIYVK